MSTRERAICISRERQSKKRKTAMQALTRMQKEHYLRTPFASRLSALLCEEWSVTLAQATDSRATLKSFFSCSRERTFRACICPTR